ncbi:WD repeat and HMG-box DNA binding-domain containing protein 1, partial [Kickxella alabastrina]
MSHSITSARYAHAEGYTAVAFNRSGQFLCTGGSDSLVRVFKTGKNERDQEAITMEQHSDSVLSLAVSRGKIITGDDEGLVLSFDTGSSDMLSEQGSSLSVQPSGTVLRSTLPARDISISNSERQVAIATDDENVRVVSLLDTSLLHTLVGHRGSVISVAYSPDAAFLASSGCDGTARVWDMRDGEPTCVQIIAKVSYVCEPGNSMEQYKVRWSPDGRMFAIPGADNSIKLVERNTWEPSVSLGGKHTKMITSVSWSSNSRYLASVGLDCQVVVWDVSARKSISTFKSTSTLCQVDWNPRANMLAFTDSTGALRFWDDVVP